MHAVIAVRYGTVELLRSEAFHRYASHGEPDGPLRMDFFFWVLRGERETILVDTGFDPAAGERRGRTCAVAPVEAMALLGIGSETVSRIVVTHLHYDHIGNLGHFPAAELLIPASELEFWLSPMARKPHFAALVEPAELEGVARAAEEGRVRPLADGEEVAAGVRTIALGGHSPGQIALEVDTTAGPAILASDAVHFYEELEAERPFAVFADLPAMYAAYATLRERAAATGAPIVPGHDPGVLSRFPRAEGPAGDFAVQIA